MDRLSQPVAILVPPGVFGGGHGAGRRDAGAGVSRLRALSGGGSAPSRPPMSASHPRPGVSAPRPMSATHELGAPSITRFAAIRAAVKQLGSEPVIHANGYPSRESHAVADRPQNFYMIGSMGLASAIGLGVALTRPAPST